MKRIGLLVLASLAGLTGCGGSDLPELGEVSGVVMLDGQPLPNAVVTFTPKAQGRPSSAETDAEGRYVLQYTVDAEGAIVGQHTVTVRKIVTAEEDDLPTASDWAQMSASEKREYEAEGFTGPPNPLPPQATDGTVIMEVKSGSNEIPINLVNL